MERVIDSGALRGVPAEGVADKQQSGENRHCLQGRFVERLAWERGEGFPLLNIKTKGAKQMPNELVTNIICSL